MNFHWYLSDNKLGPAFFGIFFCSTNSRIMLITGFCKLQQLTRTIHGSDIASLTMLSICFHLSNTSVTICLHFTTVQASVKCPFGLGYAFTNLSSLHSAANMQYGSVCALGYFSLHGFMCIPLYTVCFGQRQLRDGVSGHRNTAFCGVSQYNASK